MACANVCTDLSIGNKITRKPIVYRIWSFLNDSLAHLQSHDDNRQNVFPFPGASSIHLVLISGFSGNDSKSSPESTTKYDNKNIWWHYVPSSNQLQLLYSYYIQPRGDDLDDLHTSPTVSKSSPEATTKYNDKNIKRHIISSTIYQFMRWHSISRKCRFQ